MAFFILTILMLTIIKFRHKCSLVKLNIVTFTSALFHVKVNHHYTWAHFCWHYVLEQLYGVIKAFIFQVCLLPELLGKWYSRPSVPRCKSADQLTMKEHEATGSAKILFYYYRKPEDTTVEWIGCDNPHCPIEWFHPNCLGILSVPQSKWYCPDCRKLLEFNNNRKRNMVNTAKV